MLKDYYRKLIDALGLVRQFDKELGLNLDMRRDWKMLSAGFLLITFSILGVNLYFFSMSRSTEKPRSAFELDGNLNLDRIKLKKVIGDWGAKEIRFNKLLEERAKIVDPLI